MRMRRRVSCQPLGMGVFERFQATSVHQIGACEQRERFAWGVVLFHRPQRSRHQPRHVYFLERFLVPILGRDAARDTQGGNDIHSRRVARLLEFWMPEF